MSLIYLALSLYFAAGDGDWFQADPATINKVPHNAFEAITPWMAERIFALFPGGLEVSARTSIPVTSLAGSWGLEPCCNVWGNAPHILESKGKFQIKELP